MQDLSESFRLKVEIEKRKRSIKSLEADKRVHEALNRKVGEASSFSVLHKFKFKCK